MKILIVTDTYPPQINGAAQFTYRLAQVLSKRSHEVVVVAPSRTWHNEQYKKDNIQVNGILSVPLYINNIRVALPIFAQNIIIKTVESYMPDIVHVQGHFGLSRAVVKIAKLEGIPIIGTNHFMPDNLTHYLHLPTTIEKLLNRKLWQQCHNFFGSLDIVTTPTHKAAELFTQYGFSKSVQVISNGIDTKIFYPNHNTATLKKKYHLLNKPIALVVGRLDKEKNIDVIIRAIALVREKLDIHLVVSGSDRGSEAHRLKRLVSKLKINKAVTFTGFVLDDDLPNLYCCADVFIMAGTAELQSIVTMEAMASALPIIAAGAVALPELVINGKNGYLFTPNDYQDLARTLIHVLSNNDRQQRLGTNSHKFIQPHAIDLVIQQFEDAYDGVFKKKRSSIKQ